jgi:hypothetical protein
MKKHGHELCPNKTTRNPHAIRNQNRKSLGSLFVKSSCPSSTELKRFETSFNLFANKVARSWFHPASPKKLGRNKPVSALQTRALGSTACFFRIFKAIQSNSNQTFSPPKKLCRNLRRELCRNAKTASIAGASLRRRFNRSLPCTQPCVFPAFSKQFKAIQTKHFSPLKNPIF